MLSSSVWLWRTFINPVVSKWWMNLYARTFCTDLANFRNIMPKNVIGVEQISCTCLWELNSFLSLTKIWQQYEEISSQCYWHLFKLGVNLLSRRLQLKLNQLDIFDSLNMKQSGTNAWKYDREKMRPRFCHFTWVSSHPFLRASNSVR